MDRRIVDVQFAKQNRCTNMTHHAEGLTMMLMMTGVLIPRPQPLSKFPRGRHCSGAHAPTLIITWPCLRCAVREQKTHRATGFVCLLLPAGNALSISGSSKRTFFHQFRSDEFRVFFIMQARCYSSVVINLLASPRKVTLRRVTNKYLQIILYFK